MKRFFYLWLSLRLLPAFKFTRRTLRFANIFIRSHAKSFGMANISSSHIAQTRRLAPGAAPAFARPNGA